MKRILAKLLTGILTIGLVFPGSAVQVSAESADVQAKQGLEPMEYIRISEEEVLEAKALREAEKEIYSGEVTAEERAYWDKFTDEYYEAWLTEAELAFWQRMEELCLEAAATNRDYNGSYEMWADCDSSISEERIVELMFLFVYTHPQYYFLSNRISYGSSGGCLNLYEGFWEGDTRAAITAQFTDKINQWVAEIETASRPESKLKIAHDIICNNTIYDYDYGTSLYDQTAYSMVMEGKTVCAGYAKTMCILGNAVGLDTTVITSPTHGWNAVKLHGIWYLVDGTWDDRDDDYVMDYYWYTLSNETFGSNEESGSHVPEEPYASMPVDAPYDMMFYYDYVSPYFEVDGNTYVILNDNEELDELLVRPIEGSNTLPEKVTRDGYEYRVIGGSANASSDSSEAGDAEPVKAFVERMYTVAMGRDADESGCDWWTGVLLEGKSDGAGLANGFLRGEEFTNMGYSDSEYVNVLYETFFDRVPAEGEGDFWIQGLADGCSRDSVLSGFVNSTEFFNLCASYGISRGVMLEDGTAINSGIGKFSERLYTKILERDGEEAGLENWITGIAGGTFSPGEAAKGFFASAEYQAKNSDHGQYINALYRTFMGREAEAGGMSY